MSTQMSNLVSSLSGNSLMSSANLIGGLVAVPNASQTLKSGVATPDIIALPNGADGVTIQVKDSSGSLINTYSLGKQSAGNINWTWDGQTSQGGTAPDGKYSITATATVSGASSAATVSTLQTVTGVTQTNGTVMLNVSGGQTVSAGSVQYITSSSNANASSVASSSGG
jgi:flagellar basal-body rod modification protein FlgD